MASALFKIITNQLVEIAASERREMVKEGGSGV